MLKNSLKNNTLSRLNQDSRLRGNDGELTIYRCGLDFAKVSYCKSFAQSKGSLKTHSSIFRLPTLFQAALFRQRLPFPFCHLGNIRTVFADIAAVELQRFIHLVSKIRRFVAVHGLRGIFGNVESIHFR